MVALAPYEWFKQWENAPWKKRGEDYDALKEKYTERLLDALYKQCPQLKGKIAYTELDTSFNEDVLQLCSGEIYGLTHTPARFKESAAPRTPIKGFYLTGVDICSCGVAGDSLVVS